MTIQIWRHLKSLQKLDPKLELEQYVGLEKETN